MIDVRTPIDRGWAGRLATLRRVVVKDLKRNRYIYLMVLPVLAYYLLFHYGPMYGAQIAFKDFSPVKGIWGSPWVGLEYFSEFFHSFSFRRLLGNTLALNILDLIFGFPAPIVLALLLNEIRHSGFKRSVQTVSYMPHFISLVVVAGMLVDFLARDGLVNNLLGLFGVQPIQFLQHPGWFRVVYVGSGIWQAVGWGSIIYLAAISNILPALYEAAMVDGAGRWQQIWHITLPGMMPTIIILLILRIGYLMSVGYEKIILIYNPMTYETADVFTTYVYRKGILQMDYGYTAAVGLFNSIVSFALVIAANGIMRRVSETSLW